MSIYKDLLFLHGHLHDTRFADPPAPKDYTEGYGNEVAARRAFPPLRGTPARKERRAVAAAPVPAACGCG